MDIAGSGDTLIKSLFQTFHLSASMSIFDCLTGSMQSTYSVADHRKSLMCGLKYVKNMSA